jgi:t-SNARE complex subunit (syntaxin)
MVDEQGDMLDRIEDDVYSSVETTEKAKQELERAAAY